MGNLDRSLERSALDLRDDRRVVGRCKTHMVYSEADSRLFIEVDGRVSSVRVPAN